LLLCNADEVEAATAAHLAYKRLETKKASVSVARSRLEQDNRSPICSLTSASNLNPLMEAKKLKRTYPAVHSSQVQ
jgi:hypothetical protein